MTWTASDYATGQVEYGVAPSYGSTTELEPSFRWATHVQTITGLQPGTTYHFRTHSVDQQGREAYSEDQVFTTLE